MAMEGKACLLRGEKKRTASMCEPSGFVLRFLEGGVEERGRKHLINIAGFRHAGEISAFFVTYMRLRGKCERVFWRAYILRRSG